LEEEEWDFKILNSIKKFVEPTFSNLSLLPLEDFSNLKAASLFLS
jgi:hypothetical protein